MGKEKNQENILKWTNKSSDPCWESKAVRLEDGLFLK